MKTLLTDEKDFSSKYNTELSPDDEKRFMEWAVKNGRERDVYDYDLRGAWKELSSGEMKELDNGHLGDKYKKPNHPTFSDQSIYSGKNGYIGGKWDVTEDGKTRFTPSETNMKNMSIEELKDYFQRIEPDAVLNIPIEYKLYGR